MYVFRQEETKKEEENLFQIVHMTAIN